MLRARQCVSHMLGPDIYSFWSISQSVSQSVQLYHSAGLSTYCSRSRIGRGRDGQGWMGEMGETHISGRGKTCMHLSARRRRHVSDLNPISSSSGKGGKGIQVETYLLANKLISWRRELALAPTLEEKPSGGRAWTRLEQIPGSRLEVEGRLGRLVCTYQVEHSEVVDYCRAGWLAGRLVYFQKVGWTRALAGFSRRERCDAAGSS